MKKHWLFTTLIAVVLCVVCITLFSTEAKAASVDDLTFTLNDDGQSYTVSDCDASASGELEIPAAYEGLQVTCIGGDAFYGCKSLTSITIPAGVTSIGYYAFYSCDSLTSVTIPDSATSIGSWAFYSCSSLTDITIPDSATSIGNCAFYSCSSLTDITIPDSVISIGSWAFEDCSSLTSVTIGSGVTSIGSDAFLDCDSLTGIWVAEDNPNYSSDAYGVLFNKAKTELICAPGGLSGNYTIPDSVTSIGNRAFYFCDSLTSVTIGNSVTSIGNRAFYFCDSLTSVTIGNSATSIGSSAFYSCDSLTDVYIPNPSVWCNVTFENDFSDPMYYADRLHILDNNGNEATRIILDSTVTAIPDYAFKGCTSLTSVTIPDGVTSIGYKAFYNCDSLTSVTIPDSVTSISGGAFYSCASLTSITIPGSVASIGYYAFSGCSSLTDVYYAGTERKWEEIEIDSGNTRFDYATIHYHHTHDYSLIPAVTVPATCTEAGYTEYTCAHGEKYRTDYVPALGHSKGKDAKVIAPTCDADGYTQSTCKRCKQTIKTDTVAKLGHKFSGKKTIVAPTCTEDGYTKVQCIRCTKTKKTKYVDAIGHSFTYKSKVAATSTNDGHTKGTVCTECGYLGTATKIKSVKTVKLSATSYVYNGKVKTPTVTVKDSAGKTLKKGTDYDVTYASGRKNAGTYKVTIKFKGNYSGTKTLTFKINPANASKCKASLSKTSFVYNGKVQKPTVTVKDSAGKTLKKGTDYDVTYASGCKKTGTYKVTIKFKGNYSGTKTLTFKIGLATPTVKTAAVSNGVKVSWNKISGAKTYTIYRSTYSNGKWSTWKAVKTGATGTTYTDKTVKSGVPVKYMVKAVNGKVTSSYKASSPIKFMAQPTVKAAKVSSGIKASWSKISGAAGYIVYRRAYVNGKWGAWVKIKTTTSLNYTDKTAKKGVTYQYAAVAYSGSYKSTYKNSNSIKW